MSTIYNAVVILYLLPNPCVYDNIVQEIHSEYQLSSKFLISLMNVVDVFKISDVPSKSIAKGGGEYGCNPSH